MGFLIVRLIALLLALTTFASTALADDISVAGRSVVRVVVISFNEDGEVDDFGHGSGFAIASNRIVTNAHVVAMAQQGASVAIGVVPSEGHQAHRAHVVAIDPARDLALLELDEGSVPPIPLYLGPLDDGAPVAALGYPGNVDLATARSAEDYITPLPPTRSIGIYSNIRPINGIQLLLHTANIARGHSGGPLLDQCGRVIGVNTLITHNEQGDSSFAFAVSDQELVQFLRNAHQPFQSVTSECISMAERIRRDQARSADDARAAEVRADAQARAAQASRERALAQTEDRREARLGIAVLLLVLSLLGFGAAGLLVLKDQTRHLLVVCVSAGLLLVGAIAVFFTRPSLEGAIAASSASQTGAGAQSVSHVGHNLCRLVADRSRITVSSSDPVELDWAENGCMNGRTQYAREGGTWTRILVPEGEEAVAVARFAPATGEYVVTRYLLDAQEMAHLRSLRRGVEVKACTGNEEALTLLSDQQRELASALPQMPNERLVYDCARQPSGAAR
jgi:V8-like Glu-specific endopeptidase